MNIVITGSSTGIGRALAQRLLARGHRVWGIARSDQSEFATQHRKTFRAARCDVAEWPHVAQLADEVEENWDRIDALITCAAVHGEIAPALSADAERWSETLRINLDGTFHALRAFAPLLARAERRAKIVCFSGGGATKARPNFSAYAVAKAAVVRLVETIAEEQRGRPLDINAIAPGPINTRLTDDIIHLGPSVVGQAEYAAAEKQKENGGASMDGALDLVEWLLSPASDGISGRLLSAPWDSWRKLAEHRDTLNASDIYTLRRIVPEDRGKKF